MLAEPLLPRAWRRELGKKTLLQGDDGTDRYSVATTERRMQQASRGGGREDLKS